MYFELEAYEAKVGISGKELLRVEIYLLMNSLVFQMVWGVSSVESLFFGFITNRPVLLVPFADQEPDALFPILKRR